MGLKYGIKEARETLLKLVSDASWERVAGSMYSEIGVMHAEDTTIEMFTRIKDWQQKYLDVIDAKKNLSDDNKQQQCKKLIEEMIWICTDLIEENKFT